MLVAVDAALIAVMVQQTLNGWNPDHAEALLPRLLIALSYPIAGLWAVRRAETERYGVLLIAGGIVGTLGMLNGSADDAFYTLGRLCVVVAEAVIVILILAYPSGRIPGRRDRALVAGVVATVALLWLPELLVSKQIGAAGSLVRCGTGCPANAFLVTDQPRLGRVLAGLALLGFLAVMVGLMVSLVHRYRGASPARRRGLVVVTAASALYAASFALFAVFKVAAPNAVVTSIASWMTTLTGAAVPLAVMLAAVRERLFANQVLLLLLRGLDSARDAREFLQAVRDAVDDPRLLVATGEPAGALVDVTGAAVDPEAIHGRAVTVIEQGEPPLVMVHDPALEDDPPLFSAIGNAVAVAYDQTRQRDRVRDLLNDVRESRARVALARDIERRRIERDLHDGAQQRLVAMRVRLGLARGQVPADSPAAQLLDVFDSELTDAISELRNLARGIYPPVLQSDGLSEALEAAARQAPLPARVTATEVGRYSAALEAAVYFSCLEALQNAGKHAGSGARVDIRLRESDGTLHASIHDDGCGFDPRTVQLSSGLLNIRDRIESIGGAIDIASAPGRGTTVSLAVPAKRAGSAGPSSNLT